MRRLALGFGQLLTASIAGQVIGFVVLAVVARHVGPTHLGAYGFAVNFIGYFGLPIAGVGVLATRDIARDRREVARIAGDVVALRGAFAIALCVGVYFLAPLISPDRLDAAMLRILSVYLAFSLLTVDWVLQGLQEFRALALARLLGQVFYGLAALLVVTGGLAGLYRYAWLNVFGVFVTLVITWIYVVRAVGWPRIGLRFRRALGLLRQSGPFTLSLVMISIYFSADFVLLGFLSTSRAVGQYVVAYKLPAAFLGLTTAWVAVFFPHAATRSREELRRQIGASATLSLVVLIPLCAGSFVVGHHLMTGLFGAKYGPAGTYFEFLMLAALFGGVDATIGHVLLARGDERYFAKSVTAGALVNIGLNAGLIPALGPTGSALATVAAEAVVLAALSTRLVQRVGAPSIVWSRVLAAGISSAAMVSMLALFTPTLPVAARISVGLGVFLGAGVLTRAVRASDYRELRRALRPA